jgi:AcrR family transcriptional regulator
VQSSGNAVKPAADARVRRTRERLRQAFISLFFARDYEAISMADIAAVAGVGRSTIYEHYRDKQDLLRDTVRYPLQGLAAAVDGAAGLAAVQVSLDHFWANRGNRSIQRESTRRAITRVLAELIEARLTDRDGRADSGADRCRATAVLVAELQLGVIHAWLRGDLALAADALAAQLTAAAQAVCAGKVSTPARR